MEKEQANGLDSPLISSTAADSFVGLSTTVFDTLVSPALDKLAHVVESFPVAGTLVSAVKFGFAMHNQLLVRKLTHFLAELKTTSLEECQEFLHKLDVDIEYRQKVGENLILLLDRLDSIEKVDLISRLFGLFMSSKIEYDAYRRFSSLIDRAHLPDLLSLRKFTDGNTIAEPVFSRIEIEGLNLIGIASTPIQRVNYKASGEPDTPNVYLEANLTGLGGGFQELLKELL